MEALKFIEKYIENNKEHFIDLAKKVWDYAELPYQEYKSSALLIGELKSHGFEVEEGVAGIPTAFVAKAGRGGYKFGFMGEYDALDTLSQEAARPVKNPIGQGCPGHGCGHNLLGVGSLAAALAAKAHLEEKDLAGQVYYFGCPAEEDSGAKTFMVRDGIFDEMDFVYTWHPSTKNMVTSNRSVAIVSANFSFKGTSSHAGGSPWLGRSALDAVEIMSTGTNYLREHMMDKERIHYAYLDAGGTAANVVQDRAVVKYEVRSPKISDLKKLFKRVVKCAKAAAIMTETKVDYEITMVFSDYIPNSPLGKIAHEAFKEVGPPKWSEEDFSLARDFLKSYNPSTLEVAKASISDTYGPSRLDDILDRPLDEEIHDFDDSRAEYNTGSSDIGNVSYITPTIELSVATSCLGNVFHTWQTTSQSASPIGYKGMLTAAKAMALGALKTLDQPEVIAEAKDFVEKQNSGSYKEPLPSYLRPPTA